MAEADVLEELRALEMRRAAGALSADDEERRAEILSGLEGEALRLERDLARTAARLRLIAEFLPPEAAGPALAAAGVPAEPLAAALESALAELAPPLPVSLPTAVLGEYDADLPPAPAPYLAPLPAPEAPVSLPPSPLAAMLTPEAALTPPVNDPLPPDAPADGEPTARLAPGDLPDAPPDAEPSAAPRAATDLGFDPSAEPPFPTTADEPAAGLSFDQGAYDKDLAACPGEPGAFEPALPAAASGEGEGEPLPAEEPVSLDVLAVQALAAAAYGAGEVLDDDFPEPEVEVVEAFGEPEPAAEVEETLGEPEPEVEEVEVEAPAAVAAEALEVAAVEPELVVEEVEEPAAVEPEAVEAEALEVAAVEPEPVVEAVEEPAAVEPEAVGTEPVVAATPPPSPAAMVVPGEHRVIVHVLDGPVKRGVLQDADLFAPMLSLAPTAGAAAEPLDSSKVKAIFFIAAPGALPPPPERQKLTVTFRDARQVAGSSGDYVEGCAGFFLVPADWRSAAERIWIYSDALKEVAVEP